jgi:hypothetical protein
VHAELVGGVEEAGWSIMALEYLSIIKIVQRDTYCPSQSPILKIVVPVLTDPEMLFEVVDPAVTVTDEVATAYSPW